ncbi:MAG TPA: efflux RND transporter periplasmic adaptor subunit [Paracoccus sp. (in: a-proteobacteria)]|nr:efflux RND transporter periplasmic adaptor subunit [Paracoccus sp. (in: a-proteobacteria)]
MFSARQLRALILIAAAALQPAAPALAQGFPGDGPQGPKPVGVMALSRQDVPVTVTLPGRAVAYSQAAIRPQVGGEIEEIAYQPGQTVTAGTVLFRLDDESLAATLSAAEAAVTSAEAAVEGAQATVNRYDRLQGSGVSLAELETAQVALANARASLSGAQADRDLARLALERAEIRSPIDGVPDVAAVSVGDLVTANQADALTTVTQLDPIHVDVSESRARILRHRESVAQGNLVRTNGPQARLILETGQALADGGRMVSPGIAVSSTTGTVPFRLQFSNPDRLILPGQFVRVELTVGTVNAVLVPQRATSRAASGALTAFVVRDGRANEVTLTEAGTHRNAWVVTDGIEAGDRLVLDGLTNLRDGAEVTTVPVTIDEDGVVREVDPAGSPAPLAGTATPEPAPAAQGAVNVERASAHPAADQTPSPASPPAAASAAPAAAGTRPLPRPSPVSPAGGG